MAITKEHKKEKCPGCGSHNLLTMGLDQLCCECDWSNSKMLVDLGQLDRMGKAFIEHYIAPVTFDDLPGAVPTEEPEAEPSTLSA